MLHLAHVWSIIPYEPMVDAEQLHAAEYSLHAERMVPNCS